MSAASGTNGADGTLRTTIVTIVHGRHEHLRRQLAGLARSRQLPDQHIVVAMGDSGVRPLLAELAARQAGGSAQPTNLPVLVELAVPAGGELPLAAARNAGARKAIADGAQLLVFLDVDCIPGPDLLARYLEVAAQREHADAVLCGPVAYLPPPSAGGYDVAALAGSAPAHPARPDPPAGTVQVADDRRLFWSLSFALRTSAWQRIGGFCPAYVGYGGEDTDFAELFAAAGVGMRWVGGATAYHQHHDVTSPPVRHLDAILRNAQLFHRRWGWWPMQGWLTQFADLGLATYDPVHGWSSAHRLAGRGEQERWRHDTGAGPGTP